VETLHGPTRRCAHARHVAALFILLQNLVNRVDEKGKQDEPRELSRSRTHCKDIFLQIDKVYVHLLILIVIPTILYSSPESLFTAILFTTSIP